MPITSFSLPPTLMQLLDEYVDRNRFWNKSEMIRMALHRVLPRLCRLAERANGSVHSRVPLAFHISPGLLKMLEYLVERKVFFNKSEAIRFALLYFLLELEGESRHVPIAALR